MRRPCAGQHLLFFAAAKKSRQKKAASHLRCLPGSRCAMPQLSYRAATPTLRRKPAVNRAQRENPHTVWSTERRNQTDGKHTKTSTQKQADRTCSRWMSSFAPRAPDCGRSTECLRHCATAQRTCAVALSWPALEVQKRLSFAYFSLPLQRKVGAAPHRGNANRPKT